MSGGQDPATWDYVVTTGSSGAASMKRRNPECPYCGGRSDCDYTKVVKDESTVRKYRCLDCTKTFRTRQPKELLELSSTCIPIEQVND